MRMPTALSSPAASLQGLVPLDLLRRWPRNRALVMLHSGRVHPQWARWSILAPPQGWFIFDTQSRWIGEYSPAFDTANFTHDPLRDLDAIIRKGVSHTVDLQSQLLPFHGGWIGYFSYNLGRTIEPKAQFPPHATDDQAWPLIKLARCPDALIFDHLQQTWHTVGDCADLIDELHRFSPLGHDDRFSLGDLRAEISREQYVSMVQRTIEYIAAGDIFQANIAQHFTADFSGSARALGHRAFANTQPWYGAHLELGDGKTIISLSPELFLQLDGRSRRVITRPIKGTRPAHSSARELQSSEKDTAELNMIIDLMRNDLGRVCEIGSIQVATARKIESHPTVHHGVGEVHGTLRANASFTDLLRATFPGGSVTGAPKIRAMQIIDELESHQIRPRGPYCGAIGFISNCGNVTLNIAIRTVLLNEEGAVQGRAGSQMRATLRYAAGAGIVADSNPQREYEETLDKTAALREMNRST